ncbi:MAG: flagellar basal body-associated FliL family protein [Planctomycetota bacterium]
MPDEEKKPDEKKKKGSDKDAPPPPPSNSKKALIGIAAAVAVLAIVGLLGAKFLLNTLWPAPADKPTITAGEDAHGGGEDGKKGEKGGAHISGDGMLANSVTLDPIELKCNVQLTAGTRYATMTVGVWVLQKYVEKVKEFKRPIQDCLEEVLIGYTLEDFNGPNFKKRVRADMIKRVERLLESIEPKLLQTGESFVTWIDITAPLTQ